MRNLIGNGGGHTAPLFVIEAVKIGNSWNVGKGEITVSPENVKEMSEASAAEGVANYGCLSNTSEEGTEHGRGEAVIVVVAYMCIGRPSTER